MSAPRRDRSRSGPWLLTVGLAIVSCTPADPPRVEQRLAPGVVAVESQRRPVPAANQGWVELADSVVAFDPGTPNEARDLLQRIQSASNKPVRWVVISHQHGDHADGATIFAAGGAEIVAAAASRAEFEGWAADAFARSVQDERRGYAGLQWALPSLYFDERLVLSESDPRVEVLHFGHGHTPGDAVMWLPEQRILFAGDLYDNGAFNNLANADVDHWVVVLDALIALEPSTIVPGHGRVSGPRELGLQRRYLAELGERVREAIAAHQSPAQFRRELRLPFFEEWTGVPAADREYDIGFSFAKRGVPYEFPQPMSTRRKAALAAVSGLALAGAGFALHWWKSAARTEG